MRRILPLLPLLLLPCLLLWPVVFGSDVFLPADLLRDIAPWRTGDPKSLVPWNPLQWDGMAEFYPWRLFAAQTLKSGYLPLWNPHQFCGTPFVANSQSAVFYPLNLVFVLLPAARAFGVSVLLHLILTGSFAYLFLRSRVMTLSRPAALLGAIAWQLCHWQVTWLALPTFLCVSTWLPLALLLVDRAAERPAASRAVPLGLCLGVILLAGHLQIALYCLSLVFAYALFRVLPQLKTNWRSLLGASALIAALALGVATPQLLPVVELARASHRAGGAVNWEAYSGYVKLAVPPVNLITLFLPGFFGSPTRGTYWGIGLNGGPGAYMEDACYGGVLTLLLALSAIATTWRTRAETRFFSVAALLALLLALGTPLDALLFFGLPGYAQTGSPGRILVLWSFCIPMLAAIGAQSVLARSDWRVLVRPLAAFGALAVLAFGFAAYWIGQNTPPGTLAANLAAQSDEWRLPIGLLLGAAAAAWFWQRGSLTPHALGGALIALTAIDLLAAGYGFNRTTAPENVYPVTPLIAYLQAHKAEGRIMPLNKHWPLNEPPPAILPPNAATVYGLYDTQGYDSLLTGQYFQFAGAMDGGSPAPPENGNMVFTNGYRSKEALAASAKFVISREPLADAALRLVMQDSGAYLYKNNNGLAQDYSPGPPSRLILLRANTATGQIIVADQWYPGWHAYFGGKEATLERGPYVFRTINLSAHQQTPEVSSAPLEMRYEPTAFRVGLYALCLALGSAAAVTIAAIQLRLSRNRRRG